jgi:hypothetical protein
VTNDDDREPRDCPRESIAVTCHRTRAQAGRAVVSWYERAEPVNVMSGGLEPPLVRMLRICDEGGHRPK